MGGRGRVKSHPGTRQPRCRRTKAVDEKGCQTLKKENNQYHLKKIILILVRPVPQLEIPASDDEGPNSLSPTMQKSESVRAARGSPSPELGLNDDTPEDVEEPSDLEDARDQFEKHTAATRAEQIPAKKTSRKAKGGYKIGKQVSGNFVSYKIRSKGQRGRGRFGGGRFRR
jgi:hypothetical protein